MIFYSAKLLGTKPTGVVSVKRVLVANRGEIALRAVRARRKLSLKPVVSGTERNEMPAKAASALARFDVAGISTTIPFHSRLIARHEIIDASAHTGRVEQEMLA